MTAPSPSGPVTIPSLGNGVSKPISEEDTRHLLESVRAIALPDCGADCFVDWMGIRTRISMLPWAPIELAGTTSTALPIPDDAYRSEASEYAALALATNRAVDTLCIVEVGAGWAPWVVAGLVVAGREGLRGRGIAIEAHLKHAKWAITHAYDNGIEAELMTGTPTQIIDALRVSATEMQVIHAAGWIENTYMSFPDVAAEDMRIDLLHVDVQGVEFELTSRVADSIQSHAVTMAIGTHSRLAEGQLQQFFLERGSTLAGFTVQDGLQLYENPFLLHHVKN